ncbi:MAG: hypothetical protein HZA47_03415 [Planctomycetes bacterium]|uniref:hypothetical protein n=1 Tax=Candidatus Wunengus sp. YC65 TaxID=3367701 RepID=UPI001D6D3311|nr:hypothetical protein [Planctomycetota bacterium]
MSNFKSLEIWTAQTICDVGILLSIISFLLHIGRPYFDRIISHFTLRVAADLWWIVYIILRDGTLFVSVLFGFLNLNLDLMADVKIGLPFVPLGTVALAAALSIKIFRNTEDINKSFRISTYLVMLGAFLNTIGYVLVMEAPGDEYAIAKTTFWETMRSWRSNSNPELATITFYVAFVLLLSIVTIAALKAMCIYRKVEKEKVL